MSRLIVCVLAIGLSAGARDLVGFAQDPTPLAFDVSSVRSSSGPPWAVNVQVAAGRFTATDVTLSSLIFRAYEVPRWKVKNIPDWVNNERFTVRATFPPSSTPAQVNAMLRTLLERRFRLSIQMETREMDTDALILANADRPLGAGMHPVDVDCEKNELRDGSAPGLFSSMQTRPPCGTSVVSARFSLDNPRNFKRDSAVRYVAITVGDLADRLSVARERPILDQTGLPGKFDIELAYASQEAPSAADSPTVASAPDSAPTLPVALEQQLGLKLRRERNRIELLIVRSVERARSEEN